jgi:hypothetical protein
MMKVGKHHSPNGVKRGKDIDNGIRFESKLRKRVNRRKNEKAGRRSSRGKR